MTRILLEVCVDDPAGLAAAIEGGADRIELCAALGLGGLTPSPGLIGAARQSPVPVMAMIRPRAGDFIWSAEEIACMERDIAAMRAAGLAGVVIGANRRDGTLDTPVLERLMAVARGLDVTLHRAIDLTPDAGQAMIAVRALGIRRVLSSGAAPTASEGLARLSAMRAATPDVTVMPGAGVGPGNVERLARALPGLTEVHASCSEPVAADASLRAFGFAPPGARRTRAASVAQLRQALDALQDFC